MPVPHPRQRLRLEALVLGAGLLLALMWAGWWAFRPLPLPPLPSTVAAGAEAAPTTSAPLPAAPLWKPFSDAPAASMAPPPPPTLRLISLSRRGERWIALIDPGQGAPVQRVGSGDRIADWLVESIDANGVQLSAPGQRHTLRMTP